MKTGIPFHCLNLKLFSIEFISLLDLSRGDFPNRSAKVFSFFVSLSFWASGRVRYAL